MNSRNQRANCAARAIGLLLFCIGFGLAPLAAARDLQFSLVRFDRFMQDVTPDTGLKLAIPVPMEYQPTSPDPARAAWWLREADAERLDGDDARPNLRAGYMLGAKASTVRQDSSQRGLQGLAESVELQFNDPEVESFQRNGNPATVLVGKEKSSRQWVYQLYVGLGQGQPVALIELRPKGNDRRVGDVLWKMLKQSLTENGYVVATPGSTDIERLSVR